MSELNKIENKILNMIDELRGICSQNGLSNSASEEEIITSVFLYKFLNDKFIFNLNEYCENMGYTKEDVLNNNNSELDAFYDMYSSDVAFTYDETIEYLINDISIKNFYTEFDNALEKIANDMKNYKFGIETGEGTRKPLFTKITEKVDESKRDNFAKNIFGIISQEKFDFGNAFNNNFDFYSAIFEYLIKDYNVASGIYAEYFTPQAISSIIAKILVQMAPVENKSYSIYDPSAGSGSLVLHLANELGHGEFGHKAQVFTQDISSKSTRFLRINMLLNGLTESLDNIIEGDTLLNPSHFEIKNDDNSGLKKFDYITSNPPFKMDFSSTRNNIDKKWEDTSRFFAGIPNIPKKTKTSMAIYVLFIQHILYSLKDDGKAAIVVPTGFLSAKSGIEKKIKQKIIDNQWLKGIISMPPNIFANTGTNVSVIFIDKSNNLDETMLIDASGLGEKRKEGSKQRTFLSKEEINKIEDTFINKNIIDEFSVLVSFKKIQDKKYSLSPGLYFDIKLEYLEYSLEEFTKELNKHKLNLNNLFNENEKLKKDIKKSLDGINYEKM